MRKPFRFFRIHRGAEFGRLTPFTIFVDLNLPDIRGIVGDKKQGLII